MPDQTHHLTPTEREFLPAVLELQETPPSPAGRAIAGSLMLLFALGVLWAYLGHIDIIAVAQGRIVPSDHSKVVQPLESGVVTVIHVHDGQSVHKGDRLVELDGTATRAEARRLDNERLAAELEAARLRALLAGRDTFTPPPGADPTAAGVQQQLLADQLAEHRARVAAARLTVAQRAAALEVTRANIRRLEATLPLLAERAESVKSMLGNHYASRTEYLQLEEERIDRTQQLEALRHQRGHDQAALAGAQKDLEAIEAEFKRQRLAEQAEAGIRARSLAQELVKARSRSGHQRLIAPIDGVVQQLAVHTIGGVVTPAQQLMVIVPAEDRLQIEAWMQNKDVGFVQEGQAAEIKIEAFPFTRYGTIPGTITSVSRDAVPLDKAGLAYAVRASMRRAFVQVADKRIALSPGMSVTVEVKTGSRRLLEFLLSPLLRGVKEAARER